VIKKLFYLLTKKASQFKWTVVHRQIAICATLEMSRSNPHRQSG